MKNDYEIFRAKVEETMIKLSSKFDDVDRETLRNVVCVAYEERHNEGWDAIYSLSYNICNALHYALRRDK